MSEPQPTPSTQKYLPEPATPATSPDHDTAPTGSKPYAPGDTVARDKVQFAAPKKAGELGMLGKYRVLKQLGQGGMGAVYLAFDAHLKRRVALKVMLPRATSQPGAKERFLREARATAAIRHDNIVVVYDANEVNGTPYMAIEYLQGLSLDDYLKTKGNPGISQTMRVAREVLAGLIAAHARGLIHRDIKPANIWLEAPNGRVKILDFGLAKPLNETGVELTKEGAIMGTPAFMSPQQASGAKTDARTDLFSLGAMLYRLLAGRLPFPGENMMAVMMALAENNPTPLHEVNPRVPRALSDLIHDLMRKNPDERPKSAEEALKRLQKIDRHEATGSASGTKLPTVGAKPGEQIVYVPIPIVAQQESVFAELDDETEIDSTAIREAEAKRKKQAKRLAWQIGGIGSAIVIVLGVVLMQLLGPTKPPEEAKRFREQMQEAAKQTPTPSVTLPVNFDEWKPDDPEWQAAFLKLKPERQMTLFTRELQKRNSDYKGRIVHKDDGRAVTSLHLQDAQRCGDITPVRVFRKLEEFRWTASEKSDDVVGDLTDLNPLNGLPLRVLWLTGAKIQDLEPLRGMKLRTLQVFQSIPVKSIEPLRDMPLTDWVRVRHHGPLDPFAGKEFGTVYASGGPNCDVRPLASARFRQLTAYISTDRFHNWAALANTSIDHIYGFPITDELIELIRVNRSIQTAFYSQPTYVVNAHRLKPQPILIWRSIGGFLPHEQDEVDPTQPDGFTEEQLRKNYRNAKSIWKITKTENNSVFPLAIRSEQLELRPTDSPVGVGWAYATITSPDEENAILFAGSNVPYQVWLNGKPTMTEANKATFGHTVNQAQVRLRKGTNHIVMKLTSDLSFCSWAAAVARGEHVEKYLAEQAKSKFPPIDLKDGWVDQLKTAKNVAGFEQKADGTWESRPDRQCMLELTKLTDNYEIHTRFRAYGPNTESFTFHLPVSNQFPILNVNSYRNKNTVMHGLAGLDGTTTRESPVRISETAFGDNEIHEVRLRVQQFERTVLIRADLDGRYLFDWKGPITRFITDFSGSTLKASLKRSILALSTYNTRYHIENCFVRPLPAPKSEAEMLAFPPLDPAWVKKVQALPAKEQLDEFRAEMIRRNPGFDGTITGPQSPEWTDQIVENGQIRNLSIMSRYVVDLTPIQALSELRGLAIIGQSFDIKSRLVSIEPLKMLKQLHYLNLTLTSVGDLSPIKSLPIQKLALVGTSVQNLTSLKDLPLTWAHLSNTSTDSLEPLHGKNLDALFVHQTKITDLSSLANNKIRRLMIGSSLIRGFQKLETLRSIQGLEEIAFDGPFEQTVPAFPILRSMTNLKSIELRLENMQRLKLTHAEFLERFPEK